MPQLLQRLILFLYAIVLVSLLLLAGCGVPAAQRDPATITVEEATEVLRQVQTAAATKDVGTLCALRDTPMICKDQWAMHGGAAAVPSEPPAIATNYVIPTRRLNNGDWSIGGRVLVLKGTDGLGQPYCTDFLVMPIDATQVVPFYPVYWSGSGIGQTAPDGTGTSGAPRPGCDE